jgi:alkylation response protein AidB-like acyl-CoA dehydrogenase
MNNPAFAEQIEELRAFNDLAHSFAKKELSAHVHEHEFPYETGIASVMETAREAGLFGINLPMEWGGTGLNASALSGILEEISAIDAGMAGLLFTHAAALEIIATAAESDKGNCRSVYKTATGPDSIPLAFQSYASPEEIELPEVSGEGTLLLNGTLPFLALGGMARYAVAAGARKKDRAFSYYLVDLSEHGVTKSDPILTLGFQACQAVDIDLKDVPGLLIGSEGKGEIYFHTMLSRMSLPAAAISLGIMEGSFKEALDYAGERWQGGRNIVDWSAVRMMLAEMAMAIEVGTSCLFGIRSSWDANSTNGDRSALAAAIHLGDLACSATSEGVQLLGGNGYMKDYGQEKRMRDARQARALLGMSGLKKMKYIERIIEEAKV